MRVLLVLALVTTSSLLWLVEAGAISAGSQAAVCHVPSEQFLTIQSAVADPQCEIVDVGAGAFSENITIGRHVTIRGQGMQQTSVRGSAGAATIYIGQGVSATLTDMAIENGSEGGVQLHGSTVTIERSRIANNTNSSEGGGILMRVFYADDQSDVSRLTLVDSVVSNNVAAGGGGGIANLGSELVISNSIISGNQAPEAAGIFNTDHVFAPRCLAFPGILIATKTIISGNVATNGRGGGISNVGASLVLQDSTISDNRAADNGGGITNYGGSAELYRSTLSGNEATYGAGIATDYDFNVSPYVCYPRTELIVVNSTLSGNEATGSGGGIYNGGGGVVVRSSTLSGNDAGGSGAGIFSEWQLDEPCEFGDCTPHAITVTHSIVANSVHGGDCMNGSDAEMSDGGYNIVEDGSCITASTSFSGDPILASLALDGGATATHALLAGSPAIDVGGACPNSDQRGIPRPLDGSGDGTALCDIGSYEYVNFTDFLHFPLIFR